MPAYGLSEFVAEVERDLDLRTAEILTLQRAIAASSDAPTAEALRRAFITLLYAHVEGGTGFALACYVKFINASSLAVKDCHPLLVASAWRMTFNDLADTSNKKGAVLKGVHRENPKLQVFVRRREFVERHRALAEVPVNIAEDVVDTESNIDQAVLGKLLYQLGFENQINTKEFGELEFLKALRNKIAHGELEKVSDQQCKKYETAVTSVLKRIRDILGKSIRTGAYLRRAA